MEYLNSCNITNKRTHDRDTFYACAFVGILHEYKYCTIIYVIKKIAFWCYRVIQFISQTSKGVEFHNMNVHKSGAHCK
jgi:hypothetical protein